MTSGGTGGRVRRFEGTQAKAVEVLEAQRNFSLLEPVAVVVIRQAGRLPKAEADSLFAALEEEAKREKSSQAEKSEEPGDAKRREPSEDTKPEGPPPPPLVFWDATLDRRSRLFSAIARAGGEVEFAAPNRPGARQWVEAEARRLGHRLAAGVAETLVESVGTDLLKLRGALEVAALYVGPGQAIDAEAVAEVVPAARTHATYELQDALSARDGARAIHLLRRALDEGQELPLVIGGFFAQLRRLLLAREIRPGGNPRDVAARLGTPAFKAEALLEQARRFPPSRLRSAVARLADIDVGVKTGRGEPAAALEEWILFLTSVPAGS